MIFEIEDEKIPVLESMRIAFFNSLKYHALFGRFHDATIKIERGNKLKDVDCVAGDVFASISQMYIKFKIPYAEVVGHFFENHPYKKEI